MGFHPLFSYEPNLEWEPAPDGYITLEYSTTYPPMAKLPDGRLIVDQLVTPYGTLVKIWSNSDHPLIDQLPPDCPRAVRNLYRKAHQMYCLRGTDALPGIKAAEAAERAWAGYVSAPDANA